MRPTSHSGSRASRARSRRTSRARSSRERCEDDGVRATVADATPLAGFINLTLSPAFWQRVVGDVLREGADYGRGARNGERVSLEFGSANPTGPLVVVQGRTLSIGDTLARAMRHAGYDVFTEWIINDAGSQLDALGRSLYARYRQLSDPAYPLPEDGYPGEYLIPIAEKLRARDGDKWLHVAEADAAPELAKFARDEIVAEQQAVARRFRVDYDLWQSEKELHDAGKIEAGIERLRELGVLYEKDGAMWLRTTDAGDDEDRVVVRRDGRPTYLANDIAYHYEKLQRADHVIDFLGPDHHGYIKRLDALANAYGRPGAFEVILVQQITLKRGDEILSMSKRAGTLVTLQEVIDEVGVDAARFFFVMLSTDQPLTFDLELAKKQSNDNPVFYVQYGHARIASVLRKAGDAARRRSSPRRSAAKGSTRSPSPPSSRSRAGSPSSGRPSRGVARARAPHRLTKYAREVASDFHQFYDACRVLTPTTATTTARLGLCIATKTVLATALALCGVSAPDSM